MNFQYGVKCKYMSDEDCGTVYQNVLIIILKYK